MSLWKVLQLRSLHDVRRDLEATMNNYQKKARDELLTDLVIRCKECHRLMPPVMRHDDKPTLFYCLYCERWGPVELV